MSWIRISSLRLTAAAVDSLSAAANAGYKISIPRYEVNMSYHNATQQTTTPDRPVLLCASHCRLSLLGQIWYAEVIKYLPSSFSLDTPDLGGAGNAVNSNTSGWWTKVIDLMFWEGYNYSAHYMLWQACQLTGAV